MTLWTNHVTLAGPRNGTADHTVDPSTGTVVVGSTFTPTVSRLLVVVAYGSVTSSTPSGWTRPSGGNALLNGELDLWYRTAAGGDTFTTTHNASDFPVVFDVYEFAAGATFVQAAAATNVADGASGPQLTGLTGTNHLTAVSGQSAFNVASTGAISWGTGIELVDTLVVRGGGGNTEGYVYSAAYVEDSVATTFDSAATFVGPNSVTLPERIVFALDLVAEAAPTPGIFIAFTKVI